MNELRRARLLRAAVAHEGPAGPTAEDWEQWVALARLERVLPQLNEVVRTGGADIEPTHQDQLHAITLDVAATMVRLERSLLEVGSVLDDAGVPFAVLKGTATAHLDHPDPSLRQFGDLDLLVEPDRLRAARTAVEAAGWRQAYRLPRHHEEFTHAITFSAGSLTELDLHQRIAHRALGRLIPTAELMAARQPFVIAGRTLWALSRPDRLIHAAIHSVASRGAYRRLSSLVDVLVLAELTAPDAGEVLERARRWAVGSMLAAGLAQAHEGAQLPLPDGWASALARPAGHGDRLVEAAYLADRRRPALEELAHLRLLPGWRARARYLAGYFVIGEDSASGSGPRESLFGRARYLGSRLRRRSG